MSRITPPVTKINHAIRSLTSSAKNSSSVRDNSRHVSIYLPRKLSDLKAECFQRQLKTHGTKLELIDRLTAHDLTVPREFHTGTHRPTSQAVRVIPLMQGFRTSAPKQAAGDTSTIDFFYFPEAPEPPPTNPFAKLRVPLLPDNYNPDRSANSAHAVETLDSAVPTQEIHIVASHPEQVLPVAMSEVVGNDGLDVDISDLTSGFSGAAKGVEQPSTLRELWTGLVDDILGPKAPPKAAV